MFKRTGNDDFPDLAKCMIVGPPKSGKTTMLGTVPNLIVLDTEPHANNLQSLAHLNVPYKTITSSNDLMQAMFVLRDETLRAQAAAALGMDKIEAVAIDTLDTLQTIMKAERLQQTRQAAFLRDDWAWMKEEMTQIISAFTALPLHVFFVVHTKTKELGKGDDTRTIVLPGLEGSIAEAIAGMVGYSLMSFRKEEIDQTGKKYTKYWLRTEGDETYEFLGNRAAGRLPDVIEPDFKHLMAAIKAGRQNIAAPQPVAQVAAPVVPANVFANQTPAQIAQQVAQPQAQQQAPAPAPTPAPQVAQPVQEQPVQQPVQNLDQQQAAPAQPAPAPAQSAPAPAQPAQQQPQTPPPGDDEPVNAAALMHVKKVFDAVGAGFPEDKVKAMTMGQARGLVRAWQTAQAAQAQGQLPEGRTASDELVDHLRSLDLLVQNVDQPKVVEPDPNGTVEQVLAWVGDDLERVQNAYDAEIARSRPRQTLVTALTNKGAKTAPPQPQAAQDVQTPVQEQPAPPQAPQTPVTPPAPPVDALPTEEQAVETVTEVLGGSVASVEGPAGEQLCEDCNNPVDDLDIATLAKSRFGRTLCVQDYIAETKKPRD